MNFCCPGLEEVDRKSDKGRQRESLCYYPITGDFVALIHGPLTAPRDVMNRSRSRRPQEKSTTGTRLPQSAAVMRASMAVTSED